MNLPAKSALLALMLATAVGCSENSETQESAAPPADSPPAEAALLDIASLSCTAHELYTGLAAFVTGYQEIRNSGPIRDTYESDADWAVRESAWMATVPAAVDELLAASEPVVIRDQVVDFAYDAGTGLLTIADFGDYIVPGVVIDPAEQLPFPAFDCLVGPFFACAMSPREDPWRREVVRQWIPLFTGEEASIAVPAARATEVGLTSNPLEFEATFALDPAGDAERLVPVVVLQSLELFSNGQSVARWEGEATRGGTVYVSRMVAFQSEALPPCS